MNQEINIIFYIRNSFLYGNIYIFLYFDFPDLDILLLRKNICKFI